MVEEKQYFVVVNFGAKIKGVRLMVRDVVELTLTNELHPLVRKRLVEVVQLLQLYARLAELEIDSGKRPRAGDVALPSDIGARVWVWAGGVEAMAREREELVGELSTVMKDRGYDPTPITEAIGG